MNISYEKALLQVLFLVIVAFVLKKKERWWDSTPTVLPQVDWPWLTARPRPAALSLPLLNGTGGESKVKNFVGQVKDREIT